MEKTKQKTVNAVLRRYRQDGSYKLTLFEVCCMAYDAGRASAFEGEYQERIEEAIKQVNNAINQLKNGN